MIGPVQLVVLGFSKPDFRGEIVAELERLRESETRYALAVSGANDGLWDWDLARDTIYFSPRWKEMIGFADAEIEASPRAWLERIHEEAEAILRDEGRAFAELIEHLDRG